MSGEQLNNNSETAENGGTNPWQEAMRDMPPFGSAEQQGEPEAGVGESYYKDAKEMLNDNLFNLKPSLPLEFGDDLDGDARMYDFPQYMAEGYGLDESIQACDAKLESAKVTTPEENEEMYNTLNDAWLDMGDDAYRDEDKDKEAYAQLMRETLDGLVGQIQDFGDGEFQSLESVANHRIAKETKAYLKMLKAGTLTDKDKKIYAKRVTALAEVRSALHYQKQDMRADTESATEQTPMEDTFNASEVDEAPVKKIDIDAKVEDLQAEIQKRQEAIEYYKTQDQRDYGSDVLAFSAKLSEKQADLHVLKMIQLAGHSRSEDNMVTPEDATATIEKYISDRQVYFDNLTRQREQYEKRSAEYREITKKRGKWWREMEAAKRVAEQLGLDIHIEEDDDSDDGGMDNEKIDTGKTREQIERERKQKEDDEAFKKRMEEYREQQKRAEEQKRREEAEHILDQREQRKTERRKTIQELREEIRRSMQESRPGQQEQNELEDEEEMEM